MLNPPCVGVIVIKTVLLEVIMAYLAFANFFGIACSFHVELSTIMSWNEITHAKFGLAFGFSVIIRLIV